MTLRLIPIVCISLLSACAGNAVKDSDSIQQSAMQQAKAIEQTPEMVIAESQALQLDAQKADLYFYSPSYMEQAEDALEDAEDAIKSKKLPHEIIAYALTAKKLFNRGLENKATVLKQLSASFDGLAMLKEIETDSVLPSDFQDLRDDTKDLIILIEQGKTTKAINDQKELLTDISEVEIKTLKKTYLSIAENALEKAEDADADDYAAKSFTDAQKNIETFETFIETSAKQREQIKQKSSQAIRLAQHAEHVSKAAQPLLKLNNETAEEHILFIEKLMNRIAVALQQEDVSHLNLNSQSLAIAQTAETIHKLASVQTQPAAEEKVSAAEQPELNAIVEETNQPVNPVTEALEVIEESEEPVEASTETNDIAQTTEATEKPAVIDTPANTETQQTAEAPATPDITDVVAAKTDTESTKLNTENVEATAQVTESETPASATQEKAISETNNAPANTTAPAEVAEVVESTETQAVEEQTTEATTEVAVETAEAQQIETAAAQPALEAETQQANPELTPELTQPSNAIAVEQAP
jgi:hypothetical protein